MGPNWNSYALNSGRQLSECGTKIVAIWYMFKTYVPATISDIVNASSCWKREGRCSFGSSQIEIEWCLMDHGRDVTMYPDIEKVLSLIPDSG